MRARCQQQQLGWFQPLTLWLKVYFCVPRIDYTWRNEVTTSAVEIDDGVHMVEETMQERYERLNGHSLSADPLSGDAIDATIDALSTNTDQEAVPRVSAVDSMKAELSAEIGTAKAVAVPTAGTSAGQGQAPALSAGKRPHDVWTLDDMLKRKPTPGDLFQDGTFKFTFMPLLDTEYVSKRYDVWEHSKDDPNYIRRRKLQKAYAEIVFYCLKGGTWPVRETATDPETGEDIYDEIEVDGVTQKVRRTKPLPITSDNVARLPYEMLTAFIDAMVRAMSGEVSAQPS